MYRLFLLKSSIIEAYWLLEWQDIHLTILIDLKKKLNFAKWYCIFKPQKIFSLYALLYIAWLKRLLYIYYLIVYFFS